MKKNSTLLIIFILTLLSLESFAAKNLYLSYKKTPKVVFKNQRFQVELKALVTTNSFDYLTTSFKNAKNIKILNPQAKWEKSSGKNYVVKYNFKVLNKKFRLPSFTVKLRRGKTNLDVSRLNSIGIAYSDVSKGDKRFSGVIASELILKAYKTKQYNNKESLTVIDIDAKNSNLEDFKLQNIEEQDQSKLTDKEFEQNLIYYFVKPVYKKKEVFTYYNTTSKSLEDVTIPLILQNELVSTQTDINPNDSSFEKYKKLAIASFLILFILLSLWKRKKIYIFFVVIFLILSIIYLLPNKVIVVKKDSYIYILPTKNSTIFFKLEKDEKVEVLKKKKEFIKVLGVSNKFIGWIKEESVSKN